MRTPRCTRAVLVALAACGPTSNATDSDSSSSGGSTTDTPATTGDTAGSTSTGSTGSSTTLTTSTSGHEDPLCLLVSGSQESCEAEPLCMAIIGTPLDFLGCTDEPAYLGCIDAGPCDSVVTTVCENGSDAAYRLPNGCIPPGFKACPSALPDCDPPTLCETLAEPDCAAQGCTPVFGAPHTFKNGVMCADYTAQMFLGCLDGMISCPPVVVAVCPDPLPEPVFDVATGCIPPGFTTCGDPLPECT